MICSYCNDQYETNRKISYYCEKCRTFFRERYRNSRRLRFEMKAIHPSPMGDYGQGPIHRLYDNKKKEYVNIKELAKQI